MREFYKMLLPAGQFPLRKALGYLSGTLLFLLSFACAATLIQLRYFWCLIFPVAAIFVAELYSRSDKPFTLTANTLAGILYIALPFALLNFMVFDGDGNYDWHILLILFIFLWCNDVGAYCFGLTFGRNGRHKLFERISPKKSWEGFLGGVFFTLIAGSVVVLGAGADGSYRGINLIHWLIIAVIVAVAGVFGDLCESMLKRSVGVKDSGAIIPGHGGILDRFDGALLAFPCALAYIKICGIL
jgi:phosphatidate cytidylyltransferase